MFEIESLTWTYLAYIIVIIGIYALCCQLKKTKDLSEGHLILNLNESFTQNKEMHEVYKKLEIYNQGNHKILCDADIPQIIEYISFFAVIYNLRDKKILSYKTLDTLFSTKFFIMMNNPFVQQFLMEHKESYRIYFKLYEGWIHYKKNHKLVEPFSENSLSILMGRKNSIPKTSRQ